MELASHSNDDASSNDEQGRLGEIGYAYVKK
jgi:hypothetical protein